MAGELDVVPQTNSMKAFYYSPWHVGMQEYPPGYFKLAGFEPTENAGEADCFVLPTDIRYVTDAQICALPYLCGNESRHVFFSLSEHPTRALPVNALAFRTDHNERLRDQSNTLARVIGWGVADLAQYLPFPEDGFDYDIHAQMWASTDLTHITVESCRRAGLVVHDQRQTFFYGTLETNNDPSLGELRTTFLETMQRSRLVLVPRSKVAVNRYRFFEAMSMGRVPVLLCEGVLLPCADKIDYTRCSIRINERDAPRVGTMLGTWLADHSDAELIEMGQYGREMWERWLNCARWEEIWGELVTESLHVLR